MIGPQRGQGVGDGPRLEGAVGIVVRRQQFQGGLPGLWRTGLPGAVGINGEVARDGEQPGPGRPVGQRLGMTPRPHYRFLHQILRPLPVTAGEVESVAKQGTAVFGVKRPDKRFVCHSPRTGRGSRVRHTMGNARWRGTVQFAGKILIAGPGGRSVAHG